MTDATESVSRAIPSARFHHVGVACRDLDAEARAFALLGYRQEGERFIDDVQEIIGCFLAGPGPRLELLAPRGDHSPVRQWLARGVKFYHLAYETDSVPDAVAALKAERAVLVVPAVPAVAFGGREIAFLMLPGLILVELIQADRTRGP